MRTVKVTEPMYIGQKLKLPAGAYRLADGTGAVELAADTEAWLGGLGYFMTANGQILDTDIRASMLLGINPDGLAEGMVAVLCEVGTISRGSEMANDARKTLGQLLVAFGICTDYAEDEER